MAHMTSLDTVHVCDRPFRPGVITGQSPDFADPVRRVAIQR